MSASAGEVCHATRKWDEMMLTLKKLCVMLEKEVEMSKGSSSNGSPMSSRRTPNLLNRNDMSQVCRCILLYDAYGPFSYNLYQTSSYLEG